MAVSAAFTADFSQFKTATDDANAKLDSLGATAGRAELKLVKLTGATTAGVGPTNTLRQSFQQFDGALAAVGVNISPQIRGIEDIASAAGKTAGELGKFATAGLAAGAAMAGWQTGRAIAEFFGLDQAIAGATARLIGWDAAQVTEAAKLDVIAKAIANGADAWISYAEAIAFNQKKHDEWKGPIEAADKLKTFVASLNETSDAVYKLTQYQKDVIRSALGVGKSHAEIADALGLTTDAVDLYLKGLAATEKAQAQAAKGAGTLAPAIQTVQVAAEEVAVSGERMGGVLVTALEAAEQAAHALGESLDSIKARGDAAAESFVAMGHRVTDAAGNKGSDLGKAYGRSLDEFPSKATLIATLRKAGLADWQILNIILGVADVSDYQATIAKKTEAAPARSNGRGSGSGSGSSGSASGGAGLTSGREGPINVTVGVTVSGVWDAAAKQAIDRVVDESVTRAVMRVRKLSLA